MNNQIPRGASRKKPARPVRAHRATALIEPLESRTLLAAGALDLTFGHNGFTYFQANRPAELQTIAATPLPNGKTLLIGNARFRPANDSPFSFARLNADGSPDTSFGPNGVVDALPVSPNFFTTPTALAVDSIGRIYVGGNLSSFSAALTRYNPDGSPDLTFRGSGYAGLPLDSLQAMSIGKDGSILAAGHISGRAGLRNYLSVARLDYRGHMDLSFGDKGIASAVFTIDRHVVDSSSSALAVQPDGRILVAGGGPGSLDLARFNANGSLDRSFGYRGTVLVRSAVANGMAPPITFLFPQPAFTALAIRPSDGQIFASGTATGLSSGNRIVGPAVIAAFTPDGVLVRRFGYRGIARLPFSSDPSAPVYADTDGLALLPDGRLLIAGAVNSGNPGSGKKMRIASGLFLARLNPDGTPDTSFSDPLALQLFNGVAGTRVMAQVNYRDNFPFSTRLLSDGHGKFLVPLNSSTAKSPYRQLTVARLNADGSADRTFGRRGVATAASPLPDDLLPQRLTASPDNVYVALRGAQASFSARVAGDGSPAGPVPAGSRLDGPDVNVLAIQPDGKILAEDARRATSGVDLLRFNPDGTLDDTFGVGGIIRFRDRGAIGGIVRLSIRKLLQRPDGSIVLDVGANSLNPTYTLHADTAYELSPTGQVQHSFDFPRDNSPFGTASAFHNIALAPDGKLVVSVIKFGFFVRASTVARFNAGDFTPDPTFGTGGEVALPENIGPSDGGAIRVLPDGRVLLSATDSSGQARPSPSCLVRLDATGAIDPTFGQNGVLLLPMILGSIHDAHLAVQSDGKILIASNDSRGVVWINRYLANGSPDLSFGQQGGAMIYAGRNQSDEVIAIQRTRAGEKLLLANSVFRTSTLSDGTHTSYKQGYLARIDL